MKANPEEKLTCLKQLFGILTAVLLLNGCGVQTPSIPNLVPSESSRAPNYWCTWYWQNYLVLKGQEVTDPDPEMVFNSENVREQLNEETLFGEGGMAKVMLPMSRGDYYFLIDHGWQDKSWDIPEKDIFFNFIMDTIDFPSYTSLQPKDRIKKLNDDLKALGWRGLGLWVRGDIAKEEAVKFVEWSKYAGVEYWKIDGGETENAYCYKAKQKIYHELYLEYVTGSRGPLNTRWDEEGLSCYPSVYAPGIRHVKGSSGPYISSEALNILKNSDVFRTYDAVPLLVSTVTMQRIHDLLMQTAGKPEYVALLNVQDDCNIAAALGCVVSGMRHPKKTPRMYEGRDFHFQIAGDRKVDQRLNEMDRFVRWQRIAPPMPAGYGTYKASRGFLIDKFKFRTGDTWKTDTWGKMVSQSAPAIMVRNLPLPQVKINGEPPYVLASKFPDGAICIATEGRVKPDDSWYHPRADVSLECGEGNQPIGIFGHYKSLKLCFDKSIPGNTVVWAQDLLADQAQDITSRVTLRDNELIIPGELIDEIGTSAATAGDISSPGLVLMMEDQEGK